MVNWKPNHYCQRNFTSTPLGSTIASYATPNYLLETHGSPTSYATTIIWSISISPSLLNREGVCVGGGRKNQTQDFVWLNCTELGIIQTPHTHLRYISFISQVYLIQSSGKSQTFLACSRNI